MVSERDTRSTRRCCRRREISHQVLSRPKPIREEAGSSASRSLIYDALESGSFLTRSLGFYVAVLSRRVFNRGIDLAPKQNRQPGDIEPKHKNDDGAQRAISLAIGIKEVQICAEHT